MTLQPLPDVLGYSDYRGFLREVCGLIGPTIGGLVGFAGLAGLKSPAALSMVMNGKRNLSLQAAERLAGSLGLAGRRKIYFVTMVRLSLSRSEPERMTIREDLLTLRGTREERSLNLQEYRFLSRWYYAAIYAMADSPNFRGEAAWIASKLRPSVSLTEVKEALGDLQNLGLLKRAEGRLLPSHPIVRTSESIRSVAVRRYHENMIQLAKEALALPLDEREINGLTLSFSREQVPALLARLKKFRTEINEEFGGGGKAEQVFQVNIQFFPLSRPLDKQEAAG